MVSIIYRELQDSLLVMGLVMGGCDGYWNFFWLYHLYDGVGDFVGRGRIRAIGGWKVVPELQSERSRSGKAFGHHSFLVIVSCFVIRPEAVVGLELSEALTKDTKAARRVGRRASTLA